MKFVKKTLLWLVTIFLLLFGLASPVKSVGVVIGLIAILIIPIDKWQELLKRFVRKKWIIIVTLIIVAVVLIAKAPTGTESIPADSIEPTDVINEVQETTALPVGFIDTTVKPTEIATVEPTVKATAVPTAKPTVKATAAPTAKPTVKATVAPTAKPTVKATAVPTAKPTVKVTVAPTAKPTVKATAAPTAKPTAVSTAKPTAVSTAKPTEAPTAKPTEAPTANPTEAPTAKPTEAPTAKPTEKVTTAPTEKPVEKREYVLNTNTKKFHKPSCSSVKDILDHNRKDCTETRDTVIGWGYSSCGRCNP